MGMACASDASMVLTVSDDAAVVGQSYSRSIALDKEADVSNTMYSAICGTTEPSWMSASVSITDNEPTFTVTGTPTEAGSYSAVVLFTYNGISGNNINGTISWTCVVSNVAGSHTVTYSAGSGSGTVPSSGSYLEGVTVTVSSGSVTRAGYTFAGWLSSYDSTVYASGQTFSMPSDDVVLTAQWTENATYYAVTYSAGSGSGTVPSSGSYVSGATVTVPSGSNLTRSGYTFAGWLSSYDSLTYTYGQTFSMPSSNTTLTAQWTASSISTSYTVTYSAGSGSGTVPGSDSYVSGVTVTVETGNVTRAGYTFAGWALGSTVYQPGQTFVITEDVTLTASWRASTTPEEEEIPWTYVLIAFAVIAIFAIRKWWKG